MEQANPLPNTLSPQMVATPPINPPSSNKNVLIIFLIVFVIILISLNAYLFMKLQNQPKAPVASPTPVVQTSPTPSPDPTANWKTYSSSLFKLSFRYPQDWFVEENANSINIRIQNYDPKTAPGRGYDPIQDKGKYLLSVSKWVEGKSEGKNILTIKDLKSILPKNGAPGFYMGDPVKQILIKNEKEFFINNFLVYYFEKVYPDLQITEYFTYLLDGKNNIVSVSPGLDVIGGKSQADQILSTFRFLE